MRSLNFMKRSVFENTSFVNHAQRPGFILTKNIVSKNKKKQYRITITRPGSRIDKMSRRSWKALPRTCAHIRTNLCNYFCALYERSLVQTVGVKDIDVI